MTDEGEGKLPSVDHGRRTDEGRDKKIKIVVWCHDQYFGDLYFNKLN